jgi:galactoside O-acetyltransferase
VGDNISSNSNTCIGAANGGEIIIKNNVLIANNVVIRATDHAFESVKNQLSNKAIMEGK